jgi:hypothetical protein
MICMRVGFLVALTAVAQGPNESKPATAKKPVQIEFVKIPPGEFMMGCAETIRIASKMRCLVIECV